MLRTLLLAGVGLYVLAAGVWVVASGFVRDGGEVELLNVACDPTRELWRELNAMFTAHHRQTTGTRVTVRQSHGGSGSQARAVIDGLQADVVTLALWTDTDAVRKAGRIDPGWESRLPNRSLPYTSTIVFVVRAGNPKGVRDWPDLLRGDVSVVTPNPKTSGNGKWSFLALWGSAVRRGGSDDDARRFVADVYRRVPKLDTSARAASDSFARQGLGDVLLAWENEAHLDVTKSDGRLAIVYPAVSVLAEPHVAVVDEVARRKGTRDVAEAYLRFAYEKPAQRVIASQYYRPVHPDVAAETADRFPPVERFDARTLLGGDWDALQRRFFAEGGEFDRLYAGGGT